MYLYIPISPYVLVARYYLVYFLYTCTSHISPHVLIQPDSAVRTWNVLVHPSIATYTCTARFTICTSYVLYSQSSSYNQAASLPNPQPLLPRPRAPTADTLALAPSGPPAPRRRKDSLQDANHGIDAGHDGDVDDLVADGVLGSLARVDARVHQPHDLDDAHDGAAEPEDGVDGEPAAQAAAEALAPVQGGAEHEADVGKGQQGGADVDQRQADDLEGLHEDVAEDEDVVDGDGGGVQARAEGPRAEVAGRGVVVCLSVAEGEEEEEGEEREAEPDGEGDEDGVDEAGGRDGRGEGGVRAL